MKPETLQEAIQHFSDEQTCIDTIAALRWPDSKPICPSCEKTDHYWLASQKRWKCKECWKQFSVKVNTIFEDSPLPLCKWLVAIWLLANCRNGISSYEVARDLGITQKSAWHMMHRIRLAMQNGSLVKIGGPGSEVEADETFIGGKARNMHKAVKARRITSQGNNAKDKILVLGMLERGGHVRTEVIANRLTQTLRQNMNKHVTVGTTLYSDDYHAYRGLRDEYIHAVIDHAEKYVDGRVHTNGIENFWSLLKRGLNGTYVSVEPFHLFRYLDEQAFRYNNRKNAKGEKLSDADRFTLALSRISGKRIQYKDLTGKTAEAAF